MSSKTLSLKEVKIEGIGDASLKKLLKGGVTTVNMLAMLTTPELVGLTGLGAGTSEKAIKHAIKLIGGGWKTADIILENREPETMHSTGSPALDKHMTGGIQAGAITEFSGEFGALKTQLCKTAATICAAVYGSVLVVDTEGTWENNVERLSEIAENRGYDKDTVLRNIILARSYNSEHFVSLINSMYNVVEENNVQMIVVDSIISHFRTEFQGRGELAGRQQGLGSALGKLLRVAEAYRIPVILTNQVQAIVNNPYGPKFQPTGGHVLGHACTYRLMLYKGSKVKGDTMDYQTAVVHSYDMASIPPFKVRIMCTEAGIVDEDGSFPEQATLEEVLDE